jgi:hypothetical protein
MGDKMKKFILLLMMMTIITQSYADVEKISEYSITVNVDENPTYIKDTITIQNLVDYPLVPGIGELRLQKQGPKKLGIIPIPFTKENTPIEVQNLKGYYSLGGGKNVPMDTHVIYYENYSTIYYEIWEPIEKKGNITIIVEYNADVVDNGILFKTVSIPIGCDMDVDNLNIKFNSKNSQTYQEPQGNNFRVPKNTLFIVNSEFSVLPLPELPTYGYVLLWLTILAVLSIIFVYGEVKRMGKKEDKNDENENSKDSEE